MLVITFVGNGKVLLILRRVWGPWYKVCEVRRECVQELTHWLSMRSCVGDLTLFPTEQFQHLVITLQQVALLVAAILEFVAAWQLSLRPGGTPPPDRHGNVVRGRELAPVKDIKSFRSFTVTHTELKTLASS